MHRSKTFLSITRGLMAAKIWVEFWPNMSPNIFVTSSVFLASAKVDN